MRRRREHRPKDETEGGLFPGMKRRRRPSRSRAAVVAVVGLLVVVAAGLWFWLRPGPESEPSGPEPVAAERPAIPPPTPAEEPLDLPELDESDAFIRDLIARLSGHPQLAAWLVTDALIHRFVGAIVNIAAGASPASQTPFLVPDDPFEVEEAGDRLVVAPTSYRRYDLLSETFVSLDTEGSARLYRQLLPLFDEAYADLGFPDESFHETFVQATWNLLEVDVSEERPEVVPSEAVYEFRSASLEARPAAEKHLLRMGPENADRVQEKLRELSAELEIPPP